jgi:hypothetical protein
MWNFQAGRMEEPETKGTGGAVYFTALVSRSTTVYLKKPG